MSVPLTREVALAYNAVALVRSLLEEPCSYWDWFNGRKALVKELIKSADDALEAHVNR